MSETPHPDGTEHLQSLVRGLAEAMYNDPGEKPLPMATADATEVIHSQLTENTGTHFLDSGGAYGRHWEENQESPPWEDAEWNVDRGFVTHNVADFMERRFDRDETCVALEAALYAYGHNGPGEGESWLTCMESFANDLLAGDVHRGALEDMGVPDEWIETVLGVQHELGDSRSHSRSTGPGEAFTVNTYNSDMHGLTQVLQGTNVGGPYAKYVFLQVHQGADVRGGYTGPRVYTTMDGWVPGELYFRCEQCGWAEAESVLYGSDELLYQRSIDPFELEDEGWLPGEDDVEMTEEHPALADAYSADHIDGAVFHRCSEEVGDFGHVIFS